jgi:hypothetical protein
MKKKNLKKLSINKLQVSKINSAQKMKGGSEVAFCRERSIAPACVSGHGCNESGGVGG